MPIVEAVLPSPRLRQLLHVAVAAEPDDAWEALECLDLRTAGVERLLRDRNERSAGFARLAFDPPHELVVGAAGRFWNGDVGWAHPEDFAAFNEPGWGKLVWSLRIDPREHGGSWLTF